MKTLNYAWLCLLVVIAIAVFVLKGYPTLISYDYYYKDLQFSIKLMGADLDSPEKKDKILKVLKESIVKSMEKYPHEDLQENVKIKPKEVRVQYSVKMNKFSDCYFYLLPHRNFEKSILDIFITEHADLHREWDQTNLILGGALNTTSLEIVGSFTADVSCRFN